MKLLDRNLFLLGEEIGLGEDGPERLVNEIQVSVYEAYFGESVKN